MIYKHDYQRIALDTDGMMITQCGNDYHDYSNNKLAYIYIKWAEKHCPERLQTETDRGRIYVHIDKRITECEKEKWKIWNKMRNTDVACHAKRKKLTRKTKKTLLNTTFKSVFYYL